MPQILQCYHHNLIALYFAHSLHVIIKPTQVNRTSIKFPVILKRFLYMTLETLAMQFNGNQNLISLYFSRSSQVIIKPMQVTEQAKNSLSF
jgi:hypothetical protein